MQSTPLVVLLFRVSPSKVSSRQTQRASTTSDMLANVRSQCSTFTTDIRRGGWGIRATRRSTPPQSLTAHTPEIWKAKFTPQIFVKKHLFTKLFSPQIWGVRSSQNFVPPNSQSLAVKEFYFTASRIFREISCAHFSWTLKDENRRKISPFFRRKISPMSAKFFARISLSGLFGIKN